MFTSMHNDQECFIVMNLFIVLLVYLYFYVMKPSSDCKETYQLQIKQKPYFMEQLLKYILLKYVIKEELPPKLSHTLYCQKYWHPLLMKGLTALVISMSTDLNVEAYNDILGNLIL